MNRLNDFLIAVVACLVTVAVPAAGQQQVVPPAPILITAPVVTINSSPGAQTDPHVSQNTTAYTDAPSGQIRYYNFASGTDQGISNVLATGEVTFDFLSDVYNNNVVFTRGFSSGQDVMLFDTISGTLTTIDPTTSPNRQTPAIGGNTIAYIDFGLVGGSAGELVVHDIAANTATRLTNDALFDYGPQVAPNGQVIVWVSGTTVNSEIKQAVLSGATWTVSNVTSTPDYKFFPDTDGTYVVYESYPATNPSVSDIYFRTVAGGPIMQLAIPGAQANPSIAAGIIAFQSSTDGVSPNDLYLYRISSNELFQVTNTPGVSEVLNDITVLPNGDVRLVWATGGAESDVFATTLTLPPPPSAFTQVSAGFVHTCGLRGTGVAECWGNNTLGQAPATRTATAGKFTSVSAATANTCALTDAGAVECWGTNLAGQAPARRTAHTGVFTEVSAGGGHTCALRNDGVVECWGNNTLGQAPATRAAKTGAYIHVAAGSVHTCAVRSDGVVECWGNNASGQAPTTRTATQGSFTAVTAGSLHTCGIRADGVECWGNNVAGQAPALTSGIFQEVSGGGAHTCGIAIPLASTHLGGPIPPLCWGNNTYGQAPAARTPAVGGGDKFTAVSAGGTHTCAINQGFFVECWGNNNYGQAPATHH